MNEDVKQNHNEDGTLLYADGHPAGHCECCSFLQTRLYYLDDKLYCVSCFPKMVELKVALKKLKEIK